MSNERTLNLPGKYSREEVEEFVAKPAAKLFLSPSEYVRRRLGMPTVKMGPPPGNRNNPHGRRGRDDGETKGPWFVTPTAVRDYLRIRNWPESDYERGFADLVKISNEVVGEGKQPVELPAGYLRYRTGRRHGRMGLVVNEYPRREGDLPQLIAVTRSQR